MFKWLFFHYIVVCHSDLNMFLFLLHTKYLGLLTVFHGWETWLFNQVLSWFSRMYFQIILESRCDAFSQIFTCVNVCRHFLGFKNQQLRLIRFSLFFHLTLVRVKWIMGEWKQSWRILMKNIKPSDSWKYFFSIGLL